MNNQVCISLFLPTAGGSEGLFAQKTLEITDSVLSTYKNQGWLWQAKFFDDGHQLINWVISSLLVNCGK